MDLKALAEILSSGGWGVAAVFCVAIVKLYRDNAALEERIFGLLDKQNELLAAIKERRLP